MEGCTTHQSSYLRLAYTLQTTGFVPRGWSHRWFGRKQWERAIRYQLVTRYTPQPRWQQLHITEPYPAFGYYAAGPAMVTLACPVPPPVTRLHHQLRLLAVLDSLSDTELANWWSEAQIIAHLAASNRGKKFRVPDGAYRADDGQWTAVEVWSRPLNDPILLQKARDVWRYTHASRFRIVSLDGAATVWLRDTGGRHNAHA